MATFGRGRGRGRGLLARNTSDEALVRPGGGDAKANGVVKDNIKDRSSSTVNTDAAVTEIQDILSNLKFDISEDDLDSIHKLVSTTTQGNKDVKSLAEIIYTKCVSDRDFAKAGASICDKLAAVESNGMKFRSCLLSLVQADFKQKESIRAKSVSKFLNCFSFMCQVFCTMKTLSGEVFKPLVGPLYEYISIIIDSDVVDPDEFECLNVQMQSVGKDLELSDKDRMNALLEKVRRKIIKNGATAQARCTLLELLEFNFNGWRQLPNDITRFYCDTSMDILTD